LSPAAVVANKIVRTVELGLTITDAAVDGETTVVFCDLLDDGRHLLPGVRQRVYRDTVVRKVTDVPLVGHPLRLRVRVPRYRCVAINCEREVFAHNTSRLARPGWSTTRRCARYILRRLMIDRMTIAAVARELGLSWDSPRCSISLAAGSVRSAFGLPRIKVGSASRVLGNPSLDAGHAWVTT
jgi:transposase